MKPMGISNTVCSALNSSCLHTQAAPSGERELLYEDFMKEKEKKEREAKKAERKRRMAAFRQLLENTKSIRVRVAYALKHWGHRFKEFGSTLNPKRGLIDCALSMAGVQPESF